ncbi:MAG TPA: tyrosine recombinase XerC [Casimicrobiaceae bacterium]|nr:tyrosine recombinase XerC [Casimicrobiaceae bacterium]
MTASSVADGVPAAHASVYGAFARHLATRPAHTRNAYLRDVAQLLVLADKTAPSKLSRAHIARFLGVLHGGGLSGRSLARMLSAWRAFFRYLLETDRSLRDDPCAGLKAPKSAKRLPSALTPDEAAKLVAIDDGDDLALRDRALVELAYSSGLRLAELAGLDVERLDLATGEVRVLGKGSKERIVPVGAPARKAIAAWLAKRDAIAAKGEPAMFVGRQGRRLTPRTIERRLAAWAIKQGLARHVHPHMLRHSFASHVLQSSGDLRAVQEMLGHASIASTQVYTHLDFQALAKVYDAAHPRARRKRAR